MTTGVSPWSWPRAGGHDAVLSPETPEPRPPPSRVPFAPGLLEGAVAVELGVGPVVSHQSHAAPRDVAAPFEVADEGDEVLADAATQVPVGRRVGRAAQAAQLDHAVLEVRDL